MAKKRLDKIEKGRTAKEIMEDLKARYKKSLGPEKEYFKVGFDENEDVEPLPTGHLSFDLMTGILGIPKGKIIEFTGEESTHKSNFAWRCVAAVQANDPEAVCSWVDAENAIDTNVEKQRKHIMKMGVDINRVMLSYPDTAEQALKAMHEACEAGVTLIVVDSVSALCPQQEFDADYEADGYPKLPSVLNRGFRKLKGVLWRSGCALIEINQVRENLETKGQKYVKYINKWKTTGKLIAHSC